MKMSFDSQLSFVEKAVSLEPDDAHTLLKQGALFIDIRSFDQYARARIPHAISIQASEIASRYREVPTDRAVVLYGSGGPEDLSPCIAGVFRLHLGLERIFALHGGLPRWIACGLPLERTPVHATPAFSAEEPPPWLEIEVMEAYCRWRQGHTLIDIREPDEFERGHPAGVTHIPMEDAIAQLDELAKMTPLLLICNSGNRSGMLAEIMVEEGVPPHEVANVLGGVIAWQIHRLPWEPAPVLSPASLSSLPGSESHENHPS